MRYKISKLLFLFFGAISISACQSTGNVMSPSDRAEIIKHDLTPRSLDKAKLKQNSVSNEYFQIQFCVELSVPDQEERWVCFLETMKKNYNRKDSVSQTPFIVDVKIEGGIPGTENVEIVYAYPTTGYILEVDDGKLSIQYSLLADIKEEKKHGHIIEKYVITSAKHIYSIPNLSIEKLVGDDFFYSFNVN